MASLHLPAIGINGKTGTGKTHRAFESYSPEAHYVVPNDNGWWDENKGHYTVILNEFDGQIPCNELLKLLDKLPYHVRRRRAPAPFISNHGIITSLLRPEQIYHNKVSYDDIEQLVRMIRLFKCYKHNDDFLCRRSG